MDHGGVASGGKWKAASSIRTFGFKNIYYTERCFFIVDRKVRFPFAIESGLGSISILAYLLSTYIAV